MGAIPALRADLDVIERVDGTVEVRDAFLRQILTANQRDMNIARAFDGQRDLAGVRAALRKRGMRVTVAGLSRLATDLRELQLLDVPEVWERTPPADGLAPKSQFGAKRGLKQNPVAEPDATWACHACGDCCHHLTVELSKKEEARIDRRLYRDVLGSRDFAEDAFVETDRPARRVLRHKDPVSGACVFLAADGRCLVHARQGPQKKPDACQLFPLMVLAMPSGPPRIGLRVNCHTMYRTFRAGTPVAQFGSTALKVLQNFTLPRTPPVIRWFQRVSTPFSTYERIWRAVVREIEDRGLSASTLSFLDRVYLGGRLKRSRRAFGREMLAYAHNERHGELPVEGGAFYEQLRRVRRGRMALVEMAANRPIPPVRPKISAFLARQLAHACYMCGPLNLPDAGYGLVAMVLALEATMRTVGPNGSARTANRANDVFTNPILENPDHCWPILDAIDRRFADRLRRQAR